MKICKRYEAQLMLYVEDELSAGERRTVEQHLAKCSSCRSEVDQLQRLRQAFPPTSPAIPPESTLAEWRNKLSQELRRRKREPLNKPRFSLPDLLQPLPALRIGVAVLLFAVGFFLGRESERPVSRDSRAAMTGLLTASREVQTGNGDVIPLLAGVERIAYDAQTGNIEIHYTTLNDIRLEGNVREAAGNDGALQQMLREAVLREENPAVRLHAVKAINSIAENRVPLDPNLVEALTLLLETESNLGMRLKVLEVLKKLPANAFTRSALIKILLEDPIPALRIQALEMLREEPLGEEDVGVFRLVARQDSNSYVRSLAATAVQEVTLDPIPGSGAGK